MAKPVRPSSEAYPSVCCPVNESASFSSDAGLATDDDDRAPIFSISKSSMDVMATGPPHKRDPAWTRLDLRRSSSTNTHTEQAPLALRPLPPGAVPHSNSHQLSPTTPSVDLHSPPALSDRWLANMQRWSGCSAGAQSRSSTPDTVVWRGGSSRPASLTQEAPHSPAPDSPMSKLSSPPPTPSPLVSPLHMTPAASAEHLTPSSSSTLTPTTHQPDHLTPSLSPTLTPTTHEPDHLTPSPSSTLTPTPHQPDRRTPSSSSTLTPTVHQPEDVPDSLTPCSPLSASLQTPTAPPGQTGSPDPPPPPTGAEDEGFLESSQLAFQFPSPIPSSDHLAEAAEVLVSRSLVDDVIAKLTKTRGASVSDDEGVRGSLEKLTDVMPDSPAEAQESKGQQSFCRLELPWQPEPLCPTARSLRSPLVSSLSDSGLGQCCRCHMGAREGVGPGEAFREGIGPGEGFREGVGPAEAFREVATPTKRPETVDAAVQTASPIGSWWDLRRNNSNMGSHSILGSPPGSRLNLKSSVGSNSNLVSPSSSMFPVSSGEEEEGVGEEARRGDKPAWDVASASSHDLERRRSCLKMQAEEKDDFGRRSSMKQVQWDEDGMTWDVHGASHVDPEVLSSVIRKHLELHNSPRPLRRSTKKKRAPEPPVSATAIKTADASPPVTVATAEEDGVKEVEVEGEAKKEDTPEAPRRRSRAEADLVKDEDEEVYGAEGSAACKSPSRGSGHVRKRSVIRSLRPGWCGGSRKTNE